MNVTFTFWSDDMVHVSFMEPRLEKSLGEQAAGPPSLPVLAEPRLAKFAIGQVVKHRIFAFRGVIFDVDPTFANTEQWWLSIPENVRPRKDQPFYHLLAENEESAYVAYVSEQNLLPDDSGEPVGHPQAQLLFESFNGGQYKLRPRISH